MNKQLKQVIFGFCVVSSIVGLSGCSTLDNDGKSGKIRGKPAIVDASGSGPRAPDTLVSAIDPNGEIDGANKLSANGDKHIAAPSSQVFHFAFDDASLQEEDKPALQAQGDYLKSHPRATILLAGHTDERGSREYNVALGERRAQTVAEYLRSMGVTPNQIRLVSYGQEKPIVVGHDEAAHSQNRRVALDFEAKA